MAEALETALREARSIEGPGDGGVFLLGEGYADRPDWRPYAKDWMEIAARAELLVSAPGMAALATAQALGKPVILIVTAQPEQQRNAARADALGLLHRAVPWHERSTQEQFVADFTRAHRDLRREIAAGRDRGQGAEQAHRSLRDRLDRWADLLLAWASAQGGRNRTAR